MNLFVGDVIRISFVGEYIHLMGNRRAMEMARPAFGYFKWDADIDPALPVAGARISSSWQNMERLARVFPGRIEFTHPDDPMRAAIRRAYAEYRARVAMGLRVKAGDLAFEHDLKLPAWAHQRMLLGFLVAMQHAVITADCGTGKTYVALSLIDRFKKQNGSVKALVACPISIIDEAWGEDTESLTDLRWTSLWLPKPYVKAAERRAGLTQSKKRHQQQLEQLWRDDVDIWVANFATVRNPVILSQLAKRKFDIVIIDEATKIKSPTSKAFKALRKLSDDAAHRVAMTGSLGAKDLFDAWTSFDFADRGETLDARFTDFRADFGVEIRIGEHQTMWKPKKGAEARLAPILSRRSARVRIEDCIDLPPFTTVVRRVVMSTEQSRAHETMKKELFAEIEGEDLSVRNQLAKLAKLRQITGGFININGVWTALKTNPKMDELEHVLEQIGPERKVIVWSEYKAEIRALLEKFKKRRPVARYGDVSKQKQTENFKRFRDDPACTMLVTHPASSGHGLTMTWARYSISYSTSWDFDQDYQKNRRIYRPGQTEPSFFIYLLGVHADRKLRSVDQDMFAMTRRKGAMGEILTPGRFNRQAYEAAIGRLSCKPKKKA
jgi:hypothetical protein